MGKTPVNTNLPLNNDGIPPDQDLTGSHVEYDPIRIYSERADYSKTSKVSEVFGPKIHNKINMFITEYAKMYDEMLASGKKNAASVFENGIKKIHTQLEHLSNLKDEWMAMRGGGMRGKDTVSNITDRRWPDAFFTEKGDIHITPDYQILASVPTLGAGVPKLVNDIAIDWESKGDGEGRYMSAIQDMQEAGARGDKNPPFDVDYFVSNLLDEYLPQALSDKWGGIYALQDEILNKTIEANGGTMDGLDLSVESFNPKNDTRLHQYYANRLRKAFNPNLEAAEQDRLVEGMYQEQMNAFVAKTFGSSNITSKKLTEKTKKVIQQERENFGRI